MAISRSDRAKQFQPFDALKGLKEALRKRKKKLKKKVEKTCLKKCKKIFLKN